MFTDHLYVNMEVLTAESQKLVDIDHMKTSLEQLLGNDCCWVIYFMVDMITTVSINFGTFVKCSISSFSIIIIIIIMKIIIMIVYQPITALTE